MSYFLTASKLTIIAVLSASCMTAQNQQSNYETMVQGTISYPFYLETQPLGGNGKEDKFVIRTISGDTEYVIEIPRAATDYDVTVPLAVAQNNEEPEPKVKNPEITDKELVSQFPKPDARAQEDRALLDKAFGVSENEGPRQAPSYTLALAKIAKLYKKRKYEYALIEANNMLAFYPNSAQLYKMKGTVLLRLGNQKLAERSWSRAAELKPNDPVVKRGLARLRNQIQASTPTLPPQPTTRIVPQSTPGQLLTPNTTGIAPTNNVVR